MDYILEAVPFTNCEEEPRLHSMIQNLIEQNEVPEFEAFANEDPKKKQRRKRKVHFFLRCLQINYQSVNRILI